jgi:hypothetical protein
LAEDGDAVRGGQLVHPVEVDAEVVAGGELGAAVEVRAVGAEQGGHLLEVPLEAGREDDLQQPRRGRASVPERVWHAARLEGIGTGTGVQRATVYRHFPDEAALYRACTAHWRSLVGDQGLDPAQAVGLTVDLVRSATGR